MNGILLYIFVHFIVIFINYVILGGRGMRIKQTYNAQLVAKLNKTVHDLHFSLYPKYFKEYQYDDVKEFFESIMQKKNHIFLLIEDDNETVGYAWIELRDYPENSFKKAYQSIYVHQLSIEEAKRKRGYGNHLMNHIDQLAKYQGIDIVELDYWDANKAAKEFYEKNDFVKYREFVYKQL